MHVKQIGDWTLEDRLALTGRSLVVLFVASGDGKIHLIREQYRRVAGEHRDAEFVEIDLLENPSLSEKYSIPSTPMVIVFVDGLELGRHAGSPIATAVDRVLGPCRPESDD